VIKRCAVVLLALTAACGGAASTATRPVKPAAPAMARLPELGDKTVELGTSGGHSKWVTQLSITPDDRWLVSAGADGSVLRWNLEKPSTEPFVLFDRKEEGALRVALSPDGKLVAMSTGELSGARIVPIEGGPPVFEVDDVGTVSGLAFDGPNKLWAATTGGSVELYDIAEQERIWSAPLTPGGEATRPIEWDGALIGPKWALFRPHLERSKITSGPSLAFSLPSGRPMGKVELSPECRMVGDAKIVCPGSVRTKLGEDAQHVVRFLDVSTGHVRLLKAVSPISALSPSHDGSVIAIAVTSFEKSPNIAARHRLLLIDAVRGEQKGERPLSDPATVVAMTRSGHVLVGHASGAIRMLKP
jgi:WD40 repeat protein